MEIPVDLPMSPLVGQQDGIKSTCIYSPRSRIDQPGIFVMWSLYFILDIHDISVSLQEPTVESSL